MLKIYCTKNGDDDNRPNNNIYIKYKINDKAA
jgi:hypothetical protein